MNNLYSIILAAGQSKRMQSTLSKVLHPLAGRPLIGHVAAMLHHLKAQEIFLVTAVNGEKIYQTAQSALSAEQVMHHVIQNPPLGTGHAVQCVKPFLKNKTGTVLVVYGDTPLIQPSTVKELINYQQSGLAVAVLGMRLAEPGEYGRLITRDTQGRIASLDRIVEFAEASSAEREENLCNSGVLAIDAELLESLISDLPLRPAKGEYYLTDLVELAQNKGYKCGVLETDAQELLGINTRNDLALAEKILQQRYRQLFLKNGVTLIDPDTVHFCYDTMIEGDVTIGPWVYFGPNVCIAAHAQIQAFCHLQDVTVKARATIGPFARLRGHSVIGEKADIGNFVEAKNLTLGAGGKVKHLSYIGDAVIGDRTNIGAGVITCNYDGFNKWPTIIGADSFVGSNTALIAPVTVGNNAVIGAGSAITDDIAENTLAIARARQQNFQERGQKYRQQQLVTKNPKN